MLQRDDVLAERLHEEGKVRELYKLIEPYIDGRDPVALYYWSCISLEDWNESEAEFDKRRLALLQEAADKGVPQAMYRLACCYRFGEGVEADESKAMDLARSALGRGYEAARDLL